MSLYQFDRGIFLGIQIGKRLITIVAHDLVKQMVSIAFLNVSIEIDIVEKLV